MQTVVMEAKRLSIEPFVLTVKKYMNVCMCIYGYIHIFMLKLVFANGYHWNTPILMISLRFLIFENV